MCPSLMARGAWSQVCMGTQAAWRKAPTHAWHMHVHASLHAALQKSAEPVLLCTVAWLHASQDLIQQTADDTAGSNAHASSAWFAACMPCMHDWHTLAWHRLSGAGGLSITLLCICACAQQQQLHKFESWHCRSSLTAMTADGGQMVMTVHWTLVYAARTATSRFSDHSTLSFLAWSEHVLTVHFHVLLFSLQVLGPLLGGALSQAWGWRSTFICLAVFAALAGLAVVALIRTETHQYFVLQRLAKKDPETAKGLVEWHSVTSQVPVFNAPWVPLR